MSKNSGSGMPSGRESLTMDSPTTTFTRNRGIYLSRTSLCLITAIVLCCLIGTAFLVYHFISCHNELFQPSLCNTICEVHHHGHEHEPGHDHNHDHHNAPAHGSSENGHNHTEEKNRTQPVDVKLPRSIIPMAYDLKFIPFIKENNFTFNGETKIKVKVMEDCKNITLHAMALKINKDSVKVRSIRDQSEVPIHKQYAIEDKQFYVIETNANLAKGEMYEVSINYVGILNDHLQGFYRSSYQVGNETRWIATTQFQPTDARRAFPCFDEPALKANFTIALARPKNMKSLSNMPILKTLNKIPEDKDYEMDLYKESLPMSTYLVAFVVCDFANKQSDNFRVWARQDAIKSADYSLDIGPRILQFYTRFFQIDYPLPKTDMIALPDFSAGAMENWGLITYRETAMLFDQGISASSNKQRVATVVAHELAHQWFGNLVTPSWWSDLWLNEGFASYMEYLGVDAIEPSWNAMDQFVINELQNVFALDGLTSSHPVSVVVQNPDEINEIFDRISYGKGAAIIRMMDHFLTSKVFREGLTNYLNEKKYSSAEQDELWKFLTDAAHKNEIFDKSYSVKEIMDTWTLQTGFPVLTVERNYDNGILEFSQKKFNLIDCNELNQNSTETSDETPLWWIPVTFTDGKTLNFNKTRPEFWIKKEEMYTKSDANVSAEQWLIVNIQQTGYYRVNYDSKNWDLITTHLMDDKKFKDISASNRAQLIDDALNLARGGVLNYHIALNVTKYLKHESDYVPWKAAIVALNFIDSMLIKTGNYNYFKEYYLSLLSNVYNSVGFEDPPNSDMLTVHQRVDVLTAACHLGLSDCISQSINKFNMWFHEANPDMNNPISPNLKDVVYCTAIKHSDLTFWDFAWDRFQNTNIPSEKELLLSAMGCSREPWILIRYLERSISNKYGIRKQDVFRVFGAVSNNVIGQPIAFNFIRNNWTRLKEYLGTSMSNLNTILKYSSSRLNTQFELDELMRFEEAHRNETGRAVKQSVERAQANVQWMDRNYKSIIEWLEQMQ